MPETGITLHGMSEIRAFFRTNQTPIHFISPTAGHLDDQRDGGRLRRHAAVPVPPARVHGRRVRARRRRDQPPLGEGVELDVWSRLILKETGEAVEQLTQAPKTGIWRLDPESRRVGFSRWGHDWHSLHDETEAFYLRVLAPGEYRYQEEPGQRYSTRPSVGK